MENVRGRLAEIINAYYGVDSAYFGVEAMHLADFLVDRGVTVQLLADWEDVMDCGVGHCYGRCSNCHTLHKANSYAALVTEYVHCKRCGARLLPQPPKGE